MGFVLRSPCGWGQPETIHLTVSNFEKWWNQNTPSLSYPRARALDMLPWRTLNCCAVKIEPQKQMKMELTEQKNAISLAILIREPSIRSDKDLLKVPIPAGQMIEWHYITAHIPCNCQVNLILNDLLEVAPRPPRWSSISPNPTVVIFELLVIGSEATKNLNNVRVLKWLRQISQVIWVFDLPWVHIGSMCRQCWQRGSDPAWSNGMSCLPYWSIS